MKRQRFFSCLIVLLVLLSSLVGCAQAPTDGAAAEGAQTMQAQEGGTQLIVGFSQTGNLVGWRIAETKDMQERAADWDIDLRVTDAQEQTDKQLTDVEDLLSQGIQYLVYDPREFDASAPALAKAKAAGVPTILVDRLCDGVPGEDYVTAIVNDSVAEGRMVAQWLLEQLEGEINIVEITGTVGSTAAIDRNQGFMEVVNSNADRMSLVVQQDGDFIRATAQEVMDNVIAANAGNFNAVFCHNDDMAIGVLQALKGAGIQPGTDVIVVAIDGSAEAVQAILDGEIGCVATCSPRYGDQVYEVIQKLQNRESIEPLIINPDYIIDQKNAEEELEIAF